ncbi:DExH-box ATP-dependent RNA helicase DExH14 [Citrus sinensis]|nr:DExH-box ATP-dependent RNA helicase DExH14 [Citrus sinensis]
MILVQSSIKVKPPKARNIAQESGYGSIEEAFIPAKAVEQELVMVGLGLGDFRRLKLLYEVHSIKFGGGNLEGGILRMDKVESTQRMIRIVGLSATLPNYLEVAQFLRVNPEMGLFFFDSSYRPIPLAQQYIGISEPNFAARNELLSEICYKKVVDSLRQGHQAMVFVHSRKDTVKTAQKLVDLARRYEDLEVFNNDTHPQLSLIKKDVMKSRNKDLIELFGLAVGVHHAGMLRSDRGLTERLFSEGLLKVLVCTATLAWGVNLPAHTVVIKGTQLYDPKAGGWRDLGMLDVMQIFGRAGRPQFDRSGEGIIITSHDKLAYYLRLLTSQLPIESQFISSLKDNLNAEVALGTVTNVKEACAWLGYTYLSIRMKLNPLAYGIGWDEVIADPSLSLKQRALVTDAARALDKAKMMRFDEKSGNFYCTELGRIASHFYIQYSSVETYNEMLRRHMNDSEVIEMVSHSSEFENIVVRDEEQNELETLLYISRGWIDTFSLVSDAAYISASLARIMRALFETCLRRGWCEMSLFMLEYCKAVDRQIWPHQHPLRQFDKELPAEILRKLEERGADLDRLQEMEEKDIGALIRYTPGGRIGLAITPEFTWKDHFHGAAQRWWIIVQDSESDHIYHSELFTLTKRMARGETQKLSFTVPIFEPHPPQYYIRAVSDSWLHAEAFYCISFHNLALPQARTSHTELLDLKPLPVTALGNNIYEALYNFSHFNPIQTQIFHILYHTDNNVLLGAPTGSGKTISAELAMLHLFNTQSDMKVVYIAPLKAIVRERMNDWKDRLVSQLGKEMVEMTGDYTPDLMALLSADIIISTPEKWDGYCIKDEIHIITNRACSTVHWSFDSSGKCGGYPGKFYCPRMNSMNKPAYAAICTHSPTKPVLIFVSSRRQTRLTALDLIQFAASDETPRQFLGMPEEDLQMVLSQVLVCTSTLAWGVNLPAHLVIIKGTEYYDGKTKRYVDFPITDILQMMGRAGRPQYDQHGKAVILVHEPKKSFYKKFLYEPFPVESSLRDQLHDHFNAEIVSGTIFHKEDAVHYLSWTYLFRRLAINPAYYGLEDTEAEGLSSYLSRLVQNTFEDLEDSGCVKMTEDTVEPTMLGTIASQYYLSYVTVSMFGSNIGPDTSLEVFLHILSGASEYDELPVRHNEDNHNEALSQRVRFAVDNNRLDDPHVKANLLFQAHFSRLDLPISDYVTDLKSVLDQSIRIIQAMIDICANSGWLSSSITCMHLLQMVMQGLWFEQDSALWMFPCMNNDLLGTLRARGISTVQQLLDIPKENLQTDLQRFPRIQVKLRLQRRDIDGENSLTLNIRMDKMNSWKNTSRAFALRFPKIKDEAWWLVLGNTNTSELYALKRISFSDRLNTHMELPSGITTFQGMKLVVVSDCYLGFEQEHSIEALVEQLVI